MWCYSYKFGVNILLIPDSGRMAARMFDMSMEIGGSRILTLALVVFGFYNVPPNEPADRLLPPGSARVGRFALGDARRVVPRKRVRKSTDPEEDMVDKDEDRDERYPHFVSPAVSVCNWWEARQTHKRYPFRGQMDLTE